MSWTAAHIIILLVAAFAAGAINAAAGGGSLITFPTLVLLGLPALHANVTNTVALCPGYLGGVVGYRPEMRAERSRLRQFGALGCGGAVAGSALLAVSSESAFSVVVPVLLIAASVVLVFQQQISARLRRGASSEAEHGKRPLYIGIIGVSAYGAYFGAALGVMLLATLGLLLEAPIQRLNALKAYLSLVVNLVAAVLFAAFAPVEWGIAAVMAPTCLLGGRLGVTLARRASATVLRSGAAVMALAAAIDLIVK